MTLPCAEVLDGARRARRAGRAHLHGAGHAHRPAVPGPPDGPAGHVGPGMGGPDDRHRAPLHRHARRRSATPARASASTPTRCSASSSASPPDELAELHATGVDRRRPSMTAVDLRDVTLRDGLQDERVVSTDDKVGLFEALVRAGVARPRADLVRATRPRAGDGRRARAGRPHRRDAASSAGRSCSTRGAPSARSRPGSTACSSSSACPTPTASHNAGRTTDAGLAELEAIAADAARRRAHGGHAGHRVRLPVRRPGRAGRRARRRRAGARRRRQPAISLADTIGTAIPEEVAAPRHRDAVAAGRRSSRRRAPPRHPRPRRRQRPRRRSTPGRRRVDGSVGAPRRLPVRARAPAATSPSRTSCTCSRSPASTPASTSTP